jgi:hypothetical protein
MKGEVDAETWQWGRWCTERVDRFPSKYREFCPYFGKLYEGTREQDIRYIIRRIKEAEGEIFPGD